MPSIQKKLRTSRLLFEQTQIRPYAMDYFIPTLKPRKKVENLSQCSSILNFPDLASFSKISLSDDASYKEDLKTITDFGD